MKFGISLFIANVLLQSIGMILEKKGMSQFGTVNGFGHYFSLPTIVKLITNPYIMAGVAVSAFGMFTWLGALSKFKVNYLYPLGSVSYIIVALLALVFLGESVSAWRWGGIVVIIVGCVMLNF